MGPAADCNWSSAFTRAIQAPRSTKTTFRKGVGSHVRAIEIAIVRLRSIRRSTRVRANNWQKRIITVLLLHDGELCPDGIANDSGGRALLHGSDLPDLADARLVNV